MNSQIINLPTPSQGHYIREIKSLMLLNVRELIGRSEKQEARSRKRVIGVKV
jgi:hypothetical protein